jgi:hypothetical protein
VQTIRADQQRGGDDDESASDTSLGEAIGHCKGLSLNSIRGCVD